MINKVQHGKSNLRNLTAQELLEVAGGNMTFNTAPPSDDDRDIPIPPLEQRDPYKYLPEPPPKVEPNPT